MTTDNDQKWRLIRANSDFAIDIGGRVIAVNDLDLAQRIIDAHNAARATAGEWCEVHSPTEPIKMCPACECVHLDDRLARRAGEARAVGSKVDRSRRATPRPTRRRAGAMSTDQLAASEEKI